MHENALHKAKEPQDRMKQFAIRIIRLFRALPKTEEACVIGKRVLRSGTSVAADYRAACHFRCFTQRGSSESAITGAFNHSIIQSFNRGDGGR